MGGQAPSQPKPQPPPEPVPDTGVAARQLERTKAAASNEKDEANKDQLADAKTGIASAAQPGTSERQKAPSSSAVAASGGGLNTSSVITG